MHIVSSDIPLLFPFPGCWKVILQILTLRLSLLTQIPILSLALLLVYVVSSVYVANPFSLPQPNYAGREPDPKQLKSMIAESPGQLNFTHFLTLFGEKTAGKGPRVCVVRVT